MTFKLTLKNFDLYINSRHENFESIAAQLQMCQPDTFWYVRNGVQLGIFRKLEEVMPLARVLEHETKADKYLPVHYYIRETDTRDLICCWNTTLRDKLLGSKPSLNIKPEGPVVTPITTWQQF